ncbi:MAG: tetratricopeptide repeat protein, partial [Alphaproteobacteria bacterium]|nr:tetratricopeptide repeat protein [Alphaproteobacteria bacterium]
MTAAVGSRPSMPQDLLESAKLLHRDGRLPEAERAYRAALAARPDDARILHFLAALLDQRGDGDGALVLLERATEEQPGFVPAQINLARLLARRGALERAEQAWRRVALLAPDDAAARLGLAGVLHRRQDLNGAIAEYRAALALAPDDLTALTNLGAALQATGDTAGAEASLRRALALSPRDREALNNLGNVLMDQNRGEEAAAAFRAALAEAPDDAQIRANLGNALEKIGDDAGAREAYRTCLATHRSDALRLRLATVMPAIPQSVAEIERCRAEFDQLLGELEASPLSVADPLREIGATAFYLAYHGHQDRAFQERLARLHARACPALLYRAPHCRTGAPRPAGRRIRIGFVSTFLRNHTIGRLNRGLIAGLDRARFEVTVFAPVPPGDEIAREIHAGADHSVVLPPGLDGARRAIGEAALDVLYYTDIGMVPLTYFLAFARLAPVQLTTWGHPLTTGIANVDWFVSLAEGEPEGATAHYSERLARLPFLSTCYRRPGTPLPRPRASLGLPEHGT